MLREGAKYGGDAYLILSRHEGRALAGGFFLALGEHTCYLYGGSVRDDRPGEGGEARKDVKAPDAFYWNALLDAKAHGYRVFDFWGIPRELDESKHSFGVFKMKLKFSEDRVWFPAYDLPLNAAAPVITKACAGVKPRTTSASVAVPKTCCKARKATVSKITCAAACLPSKLTGMSDMYELLLTLHSWVRWLVLLTGLWAGERFYGRAGTWPANLPRSLYSLYGQCPPATVAGPGTVRHHGHERCSALLGACCSPLQLRLGTPGPGPFDCRVCHHGECDHQTRRSPPGRNGGARGPGGIT
ncbi:peptidoglycan bridge formation glycyltransferase FemA/FemB family protein [Deinococcus radiophilus]|uniref:peptidoglycan bridge formation glycyltransferase FemA/FemB family protein n=1 Tax=Deinococcus radiophilus TaxID=32062 RepID=UPI0036079B1A